MLCALGQVVTPLDGLGAGARSRRILEVSNSVLMQARLRRDFADAAWSPTGPTESRSARSMPRICRDWPGLFRFDKVAEYSGDLAYGRNLVLERFHGSYIRN